MGVRCHCVREALLDHSESCALCFLAEAACDAPRCDDEQSAVLDQLAHLPHILSQDDVPLRPDQDWNEPLHANPDDHIFHERREVREGQRQQHESRTVQCQRVTCLDAVWQIGSYPILHAGEHAHSWSAASRLSAKAGVQVSNQFSDLSRVGVQLNISQMRRCDQCLAALAGRLFRHRNALIHGGWTVVNAGQDVGQEIDIWHIRSSGSRGDPAEPFCIVEIESISRIARTFFQASGNIDVRRQTANLALVLEQRLDLRLKRV